MTPPSTTDPGDARIDVLTVCSGNTCRSPMAEVLLAHHLSVRGVPARVHSAGTLGWGGGATDKSVQVMADHGLDLTDHGSRRLDSGLVVGADLVLGMTRDHVSGALLHDPTAVDRAFVIGELVRLGEKVGPLRPGEKLRDWTEAVAALRPPGRPPGRGADEVADPVGEPIEVYTRTAARLDALTAAIAELLEPGLADASGPHRR